MNAQNMISFEPYNMIGHNPDKYMNYVYSLFILSSFILSIRLSIQFISFVSVGFMSKFEILIKNHKP